MARIPNSPADVTPVGTDETENPAALAAAMANRQGSWDRERFFALDEERRSVISQVEDLQATRNAESKKTAHGRAWRRHRRAR